MKLILLSAFVAAAQAASVYLRCDCNNEQAYGRNGRQLQVLGLTGYEPDQVICEEVCRTAIEQGRLNRGGERFLRRNKRQVPELQLPYNPALSGSALPRSGGVAGVDGVPIPPGISVEAGPFNPYGRNPTPRHGPYHPGTLPGSAPVGYFPSCNYDCIEKCPQNSPCYFACQRHLTAPQPQPVPVRSLPPPPPPPPAPVPIRAPPPPRPAAPLRFAAPPPPPQPILRRAPFIRRAPLLRQAPLLHRAPLVQPAPIIRPAPVPIRQAPLPIIRPAPVPVLPATQPIMVGGPIHPGVPTVTRIEHIVRPITIYERIYPDGPHLAGPFARRK